MEQHRNSALFHGPAPEDLPHHGRVLELEIEDTDNIHNHLRHFQQGDMLADTDARPGSELVAQERVNYLY